MYVDSDDALTNDCIEKLKAPIEHDPIIEMVIGNAEWLPDGCPLPSKFHMKHHVEELKGLESVRDYFFNRNDLRVCVWNRLVKKDLLNLYDLYDITFKENILWEDWLWIFGVMKHLGHLYIIPDFVYLNYRRPNSITTSGDIETRLHHMGMVFYEISNNFTYGDRNREAKYYVGGFCCEYIYCPKNELYKKIAQNFRRELSVCHDPVECMLLFFTNLLSKTELGRKWFRGMHKIYTATHCKS